MATLEPRTVREFEEYLRSVDAQMVGRAAAAAAVSGVTQGVTAHARGKEVRDGLVHDWSAATFIPGARKAQAVAVLEDFSRHPAIYPEVVEGRVEKREPGRIFGFHLLRKKKVLEVNLEARYQLEVLPSPPNRYASRSTALSITELENVGTTKEKRLPPGQDHGFLWRLQTYWILEETSEGLWMEVRSVSLTRDVPMGLGWAVKPIVKDLPRESLEALMAATRKAVLGAK